MSDLESVAKIIKEIQNRIKKIFPETYARKRDISIVDILTSLKRVSEKINGFLHQYPSKKELEQLSSLISTVWEKVNPLPGIYTDHGDAISILLNSLSSAISMIGEIIDQAEQ